MSDALLTRSDVAAVLGLSLRTVIRLEESGELVSIRIGPRHRAVRFEPAEVARYLAARRESALAS